LASSPLQNTALSVAVKFLAHSERFESEVRKKLSQFDPDEIEAAISKLKIQNILNDQTTAERFVKSREGRKSIGSFRLTQELRQRGAPEDVIAEVCGPGDDEARAIELLSLKFLNQPELKAKAYRFLLSRGFGFETAHNAVRNFFSVDV
jgi:regulatory protein